MSFPLAFVNGKFIPLSKAQLSISDLSIARGYALSATIRTYEKQPFHWEKHVERLKNGCHKLGLNISYSKEDFYTIMRKMIPKQSQEEWTFKIFITGGISSNLQINEKPGLVIFCTPYLPYPSSFYEEGVELATFSYERFLPEIKTSSYLPAIQTQQKNPAIFEVLYLSTKQEILESATSNFFCVKKGKLLTPSENIYPGVTREVLLSLFSFEQRPIFYKELPEMEEVFLAATNKEVIPIKKIDSFSFPKRKTVQYIQKALTQYIQKKQWIQKERIKENDSVCS